MQPVVRFLWAFELVEKAGKVTELEVYQVRNTNF